MPGTWSISTTIRNPERNIPFLKALSRFEGQVFDERVQRDFFKELIKLKAYKPNGISSYYADKYQEPEEFTYEEVEEILSQVHYTNKEYNDDQEQIYALRGRTAVGNLNKMGLVIARKSMGSVLISDLGKEVMSGKADLSNVFLRYCLKWQLPNPAERGYNEFNIIPFIATLHVIYKVNKKWESLGKKPVGISKEEFALFVITLINYKEINERVKKIIQFREELNKLKRNERQNFIYNKFIETAIEVFNLNPSDNTEITKKVNNLYDYADSAIRYYRQTKFLMYRGNGRYVDLAPTRIVEIKSILKKFSGEALEFDSLEDYLDYIADINQPVLPWENIKDLQDVYNTLFTNAINLQTKIENQYRGQSLHQFNLEYKELNNIVDYNYEISRLREIIRVLHNDLLILKEKSLENIDFYIEKLMELANRRRSVSGQDPLNLEWFVTLSLMAIDDAEEISPNYVVGDDNVPIFTAPGNRADIECYYNTFNMICEVTLLRGRDQWYNEGQPVMRHLRDFEDKTQSNFKDTYCLFIAPTIHRDTLNTFWMGVKLGYEGQIQKLIPLTIKQYVRILEIVKELNYKGKRINHIDFKYLLDLIFDSHEQAGNDSTVWIQNFDDIISYWSQSLA